MTIDVFNYHDKKTLSTKHQLLFTRTHILSTVRTGGAFIRQ